MKLKCLKCGHEYDGSISKIKRHWRGRCPVCNSLFKVEVPKGPIVMAFADGSNYDNFTEEFTRKNIISYYAFETVQEFIAAWRKMVENPDSFWYWVINKRHCVCSGACDPYDISIFYVEFGRQEVSSAEEKVQAAQKEHKGPAAVAAMKAFKDAWNHSVSVTN